MSILRQSDVQRSFAVLSAGFERFAEETAALLSALLNPSRFVGDVEQMRALQLQASRIEATDPARAAVLRQRAARILR